jgi:RNase P protein component
MDYSAGKSVRMKKRAEISRVFTQGRRLADSRLTLWAIPTEGAGTGGPTSKRKDSKGDGRKAKREEGQKEKKQEGQTSPIVPAGKGDEAKGGEVLVAPANACEAASGTNDSGKKGDTASGAKDSGPGGGAVSGVRDPGNKDGSSKGIEGGVAGAPGKAVAPARCGVAVSKGHGIAVRRNRIKRVCREAFRLVRNEFPSGWDYMIVPRVGAELKLRGIQESLLNLAHRLASSGAKNRRP